MWFANAAHRNWFRPTLESVLLHMVFLLLLLLLCFFLGITYGILKVLACSVAGGNV